MAAPYRLFVKWSGVDLVRRISSVVATLRRAKFSLQFEGTSGLLCILFPIYLEAHLLISCISIPHPTVPNYARRLDPRGRHRTHGQTVMDRTSHHSFTSHQDIDDSDRPIKPTPQVSCDREIHHPPGDMENNCMLARHVKCRCPSYHARY